MRILHTADWHLNASLGHLSRQDDLCARLQEIAQFLKTEQVDVMVVAGDLFNGIARLADLQAAIAVIGQTFRAFLSQQGTILAVSGNHDGDLPFTLLRTALDLASPLRSEVDGTLPLGRLYVTEGHSVIRLADRRGEVVQFALLPYPTPSRYLRGEEADYKGSDQKNANLHRAVRVTLENIIHRRIDPALPVVLISHLNVRGSQVHSLYEISEREDVIFDPGDVPATWTYAAYGHIHRAQMIRGQAHMRYSGSIDRMDFAERQDAKSVVVFEVQGKKLVGQPMLYALNATPMLDLSLTHPQEELPRLADEYSPGWNGIAKISVRYRPGVDNPDAIRAELERIFTRIYQREIIPYHQDAGGAVSDVSLHTSFRQTVIDYLGERFAANEDREQLVGLAEDLIDRMEGNPL